jgi:hypothetical protein
MSAKESRRISVAGLFFIAGILVVALSSSRQNSLVSGAQDQAEELVLPVADYNTPEPLNSEDKSKRLKRSKRYDHQSGESIKEPPYPVERIWSAQWTRDIPPVPVSQSDLILIGTIIDSHAYLSADKTAVYSEFQVHVEQALNGPDVNTPPEPIVFVDRFGGAVRFPSGVIQKYRASGQGMPREGCRYLLFLKRTDQNDDFSILTGYELRSSKVVPLDGSTQRGNEPLPFDRYQGVDVAAFLKIVHDAIAEVSYSITRVVS